MRQLRKLFDKPFAQLFPSSSFSSSSISSSSFSSSVSSSCSTILSLSASRSFSSSSWSAARRNNKNNHKVKAAIAFNQLIRETTNSEQLFSLISNQTIINTTTNLIATNISANTTTSTSSLHPSSIHRLHLPLSQWDHVHCSTALKQFTTFSNENQLQIVRHQTFQLLLQHILHIQHEFRAREIASACHSIARLGVKLHSHPLIKQVIRDLSHQYMQPHILANANAFDLSNLVWSHDELDMKMSEYEHMKPLFDCVAVRFIQPHILSSSPGQSYSNIALAFAGREYVCMKLFDGMCDYLLDHPDELQKWGEQALSNYLHSHATLMIGCGVGSGRDGNESSESSSSESESQSETERTSPAPSNRAMRMNKKYQQLYHLIIINATKRITRGEFTSQHIANISWSIAKLSDPGSAQLQLLHTEWFQPLLSYLLDNHQQQPHSSLLSRFEPQEFSNLIWSLAQFYHNYVSHHQRFYSLLHRFLQCIADVILDRPKRMADFNAQDLANTALSYADLRYLHRGLMKGIAQHAVQTHLNSLDKQSCSNLILAFANFGTTSQTLYSALCDRYMKLIKMSDTVAAPLKVTVQHLVNMCWSLAVANQLHHNSSAQFVTYIIQRLNSGEFDDELNSEAYCQLHQLQLTLLLARKQQQQNDLSSSSPSSSSSSISSHSPSPSSSIVAVVSSIPLLSASLAARCRSVMSDESYISSSNAQKRVGATLKRMGIEYKSEALLSECGYRVDFLITFLPPHIPSPSPSPSLSSSSFSSSSPRPLKLIVEYDGPSHYYTDTDTDTDTELHCSDENPAVGADSERVRGERGGRRKDGEKESEREMQNRNARKQLSLSLPPLPSSSALPLPLRLFGRGRLRGRLRDRHLQGFDYVVIHVCYRESEECGSNEREQIKLLTHKLGNCSEGMSSSF